jgi:peptidoglycan/xylan/chitin deacetylase (PgdA/CDA1 family)
MVRRVALRRTLAAVLVAVVLVASALPSTATTTATAAGPSREPVPILMYHAIRTAPADARLPSLFVRPRLFAAQVRALRQAGYHAVTLQRVWDAWHGDATLPRRPIVLSFDDGYPSQVGIALPVLRREGWPGVLNLTLKYLDQLGGASAVRQLIDAGWEIDAHTRTHPDLTRVTDSRLVDEVQATRTEIADRFGIAANFFCYPGGAYDTRVVAAVRQAGYLAATTTHMGFATPGSPFTLKRVTVDGGSDAGALLRRLAKLRGRAGA